MFFMLFFFIFQWVLDVDSPNLPKWSHPPLDGTSYISQPTFLTGKSTRSISFKHVENRWPHFASSTHATKDCFTFLLQFSFLVFFIYLATQIKICAILVTAHNPNPKIIHQKEKTKTRQSSCHQLKWTQLSELVSFFL